MAFNVFGGSIAGTLMIRIGADTSGLTHAQRAVQQFGTNMRALGTSLAVLSLPVVAFGKASVDAFRKFDDAMNSTLSIMGNVSEEMKNKLEKAALNVGATTRTSSVEAAFGLRELAQAGFDVEDSLANLPTVVKFAQAGMMNMEGATTRLADLMNALGLASKNNVKTYMELKHISDVVVKAGILATETTEQMSDAMGGRAAAAASQAGVAIEELAASMVVLSSANKKGKEGSEAFGIFLRDLTAKARQNEAAFAKWGIQVVDTRTGALNPLADTLERINSIIKDLNPVEQDAVLGKEGGGLGFSDKAIKNVKAMAPHYARLRDLLEQLKKAAGTTDEIAKLRMEGFSGAMDALEGKLFNVRKEIGEKLAPSILQLGIAVYTFTQIISEMSQESFDSAVQIGAISVAASAAATLIGFAVIAVSTFLTGIVALGVILGKVAGGLWFLAKGVLYLALGPFYILGLAVVALYRALMSLALKALSTLVWYVGNAGLAVLSFATTAIPAALGALASFVMSLGKAGLQVVLFTLRMIGLATVGIVAAVGAFFNLIGVMATFIGTTAAVLLVLLPLSFGIAYLGTKVGELWEWFKQSWEASPFVNWIKNIPPMIGSVVAGMMEMVKWTNILAKIKDFATTGDANFSANRDSRFQQAESMANVLRLRGVMDDAAYAEYMARSREARAGGLIDPPWAPGMEEVAAKGVFIGKTYVERIIDGANKAWEDMPATAGKAFDWLKDMGAQAADVLGPQLTSLKDTVIEWATGLNGEMVASGGSMLGIDVDGIMAGFDEIMKRYKSYGIGELIDKQPVDNGLIDQIVVLQETVGWWQKAKDAMYRYAAAIGIKLPVIGDAAKSELGTKFGEAVDSMAQALLRGQDAFQVFMDAIIQMLYEVFLQQQLIQLGQNLMGAFLGTPTSTVTGPASDLSPTISNPPLAWKQVYDQSAMFPGEQAPAMMGRGGSQLNLTIVDQNNNNVETEQTTDARGMQQLRVMLRADTARDISKNGVVGKAITGSFGGRYRGGRR